MGRVRVEDQAEQIDSICSELATVAQAAGPSKE
jgi:hypothetical protein